MTEMSEPKTSRTPVEKYYHGLLAGSAQTLAVYPLDIMRLRYFLRNEIKATTSRNILKFYPALGYSLVTNTLKYTLYYPTQDLISTDPSIIGNLICGLLLGLFTTPINTIKVPLQQDGQRQWLKVAQSIHSREGIRGFFNGGVATISRDTMWTVAYFGLFQHFCQRKEWDTLSSSVLSCILATTLTYPFDGARLCQQQHHHQGQLERKFFTGFRESFRFNSTNLRSYVSGITRVTAATTLGHYLYLWLNKCN